VVLLVGHLPSLGLVAALLLGAKGAGGSPLIFEPATLCQIQLDRMEPGRGRLVLHLPATLAAGLGA
jgi:phosphohistidine phosphatase SixA